MPQKSISMTLLAIQYVFSTYRNTESPYRNISQYGFARRCSPLQIDSKAALLVVESVFGMVEPVFTVMVLSFWTDRSKQTV